ncbi:MAG TPA: efflux RND transporter periplasmic adaptor subunit [Vicinamibacteria bacterium]|nr:efflux RND transporter periplasmic adaptor subunit [Vicinamibacteria bacterium]
METRTILATGVIGAALLAGTAIQARNAGLGGGKDVEPTAPAALGKRGVAAEGRVVAYPGAEVGVAAERGGRLLSVRVVEGQKVRRGELLAEIDSEELRAALAEAKARVTEAEAQARLTELTLERRGRLREEDVVSAHEVDEARRDLETARARRDTAQAEVERYQAQLRKSRVLAPIAGTVTARQADAGETVAAGDPIATLADLDRLRVEGEADEADAAVLVVGAPVAITADGYPGAFRGRIEEVADSVTLRRLKPQDPSRPTDTRIVSVKVALGERTPLKLGATVELRIEPRQ